MKNIFRLFFTLKDLQLIQIFGRIKFNFFVPRIKLKDNSDKIHKISNYKKFKYIKKKESYQKINDKYYFSILNKNFIFNENFNWNSNDLNKLSIYHLNYFNFVNSSENLLDPNNLELIKNWILNNKSYKLISLNSYTSSLRIVNWIKWSISNNYSESFFINSLSKQTLWLSKRIEYHIQGNHLIANAKALIFSGLYLYGNQFKAIYHQGIDLLEKELEKQILSDGAHFERSPMYHIIIIEDLIDIINIHKLFNKKFNPFISQNLNRMMKWYKDILHVDYQIPFFNDSCLDNTASYDQIIKLYREIDTNNEEIKTSDTVKLSDASGYFIYKKKDISFIMNVGEIKKKQQPGHSHADLNSFELAVHGIRVFVNTGISTYENNYRRKFERSTKAHNTLEINNRNSSDVWASFRVGKKAKIKYRNLSYNENSDCEIECSHNGYTSLFNNIIHTRKCTIMKKKLIIEDSVNKKCKNAIVRLYLHPDIKFINNKLILPNNKTLSINFGDNKINITDSHWSRSFNEKIKNICLEFKILEKNSRIEILW
jgi:uncharacterized heparinase superfamily protein